MSLHGLLRRGIYDIASFGWEQRVDCAEFAAGLRYQTGEGQSSSS